MISPTEILHTAYERIHGFDPMASTTVNTVRTYLGLEPVEGDRKIRVPSDLLDEWRNEFENNNERSFRAS